MTRYATYAPEDGGRPVDCAVRSAVPADAERIAEIDGERNGIRPETIVDRVRAGLERPREGDHVLVAEVDGRVIGFGRLRWIEPDASYRNVPRGWFLVGTIVDPAVRRGGVGRALLAARLALVGDGDVHYLTNHRNEASIALHRPFGFEELTRDFVFPGAEFGDGIGILFRRLHRPPSTGIGTTIDGPPGDP